METNTNCDRVLFVDDEAFILFSLRRLFKQNNIEIDVETDCIKAVELIKQNKYKVVVSDFKMPSMNGADFLDVVKEISPDTIRLMISAHVTQESLCEVVNKGEVYRFISKPWKDRDLINIVKDSIAKFNRLTFPILNTAVKDNPQEKMNKDNKTVEPDLFLNSILPPINYLNLDIKKELELIRGEQFQNLIYIMNLYSPKIALHCKRVAQLSLYVGKKMKLREENLNNLYTAGLFHDLGRVFEFSANADHSELSFNLLSLYHELKDSALITKYHHTRIDASESNSIPIESKILCIVDYFDKAITKEKKFDDEIPLSLSTLIATMREEKDKKFDSEILEIFIEVITNEFKLDMFFNETKLHLIDLEDGMVLSRPIFNKKGKLLLNSEYKITKEIISRLFAHNKNIEIQSPLFVYSKTPEKKFNFNEFLANKIKT